MIGSVSKSYLEQLDKNLDVFLPVDTFPAGVDIDSVKSEIRNICIDLYIKNSKAFEDMQSSDTTEQTMFMRQAELDTYT